MMRGLTGSARLLALLGGLASMTASAQVREPVPASRWTPFPLPSIAQPTVNAEAGAPPPQAAESLSDLLRRVLPADPQVRSALALARAAGERLMQVRSRLGPALYLQFTAGQGRDVDGLLERDRRTERSEAGLRWNLYNGGNDWAELRAAGREVEAAEEESRRAREEATERISETYVEVLRQQAHVGPAADRLNAVRRLAEQVRQQLDAGRASLADLAQADASLIDAEVAHEQARAELESARAKLAAQVGTDVRTALPVLLDAGAAAGAAVGEPGLVSAARQRAEAARERVRPAASTMAPRIDLEVRQQISDRTQPAVTTAVKRGWQIVARWDLPVLGETIARRNEGLRRAEAAEAESERVARNVRADLMALDARIQLGERAVAALQRQVQQYEQLVRAAELQFDASRRSLQQLITLRDSRYAVEQRLAEQAHRLLADRMRQLALAGRLMPALGLGP